MWRSLARVGLVLGVVGFPVVASMSATPASGLSAAPVKTACKKLVISATGTGKVTGCNVPGANPVRGLAHGTFPVSDPSSFLITWENGTTTQVSGIVSVTTSASSCTGTAYKANGLVVADTTHSLLGDEFVAGYCVKVSGATVLTSRKSFAFVPPTAITVSPAGATVLRQSTLQFTATGTYPDGTTRDLTDVVTWASSDTSILSISNTSGSQGLASTSQNWGGPLTIGATDEDLTATTTVNVSCQYQHANGLGGFFYDCNDPGTYNEVTAMEAAMSWNPGFDAYEVECPNSTVVGLESDKGSQSFVWWWSGNAAGWVTTAVCPVTQYGRWN